VQNAFFLHKLFFYYIKPKILVLSTFELKVYMTAPSEGGPKSTILFLTLSYQKITRYNSFIFHIEHIFMQQKSANAILKITAILIIFLGKYFGISWVATQTDFYRLKKKLSLRWQRVLRSWS
jgi:hypothetical protein